MGTRPCCALRLHGRQVAAEESSRLSVQLGEIRKQLKESESRSKELEEALGKLENEKQELADIQTTKAQEVFFTTNGIARFAIF